MALTGSDDGDCDDGDEDGRDATILLIIDAWLRR